MDWRCPFEVHVNNDHFRRRLRAVADARWTRCGGRSLPCCGMTVPNELPHSSPATNDPLHGFIQTCGFIVAVDQRDDLFDGSAGPLVVRLTATRACCGSDGKGMLPGKRLRICAVCRSETSRRHGHIRRPMGASS
eukprot:scaffold775_cov274-Pinguiococcus_pyrenoidosus.AAC.18